MKIVLARIDDRLIHGQVATVWSKATDCQRIIVCDDEVAKDKIRAVLLKQLAPAGVKSHVVDLAKAVRIYHNPKYENDRCLLLFTNPTSVLYLVELTSSRNQPPFYFVGGSFFLFRLLTENNFKKQKTKKRKKQKKNPGT